MELLVSVVIVGIATAGMTELVWLGASWASSLNNRMDNFTAARFFLGRLERDTHQCVDVLDGTTPHKLIMSCLSKNDIDSDGYPKDSNTKVMYEVKESTPPDSGYQIERSTDDGTPVIVLRGIVGPKLPTEVRPHVFQFAGSYPSESDPLYGLNDTFTPGNTISEIVINLELDRHEFSSSDPSNTALSCRTEFFLRNNGYRK